MFHEPLILMGEATVSDERAWLITLTPTSRKGTYCKDT